MARLVCESPELQSLMVRLLVWMWQCVLSATAVPWPRRAEMFGGSTGKRLLGQPEVAF